MVSAYDRDSFAGLGNRLDRGGFAWPVSRERLDDQLKHGTMVLAVEVNGAHKAYDLSGGSNWVANDVVGGERVVVVGRRDGDVAAAFLSKGQGRALTFRLTDESLEDTETGNRWDDSGLTVSGPLAGTRLEAVSSRTSF